MPLPSIWRLYELFVLSDKYPSGLEWKVAKSGKKPGDPVGRLNKRTGYYMVSVDNKVYLAHRIVEFMRTEEDLSYCIVTHGKDNPEKDNRKRLVVTSVAKPTQYKLMGD